MPEPMRISIALCTCNGERFLAEQLNSLAKQIYLPTELVVCDDASEDGTYSILQNFANNSAFPVHLYRNPQRLGIGANFEQAIQLCKGEIIALCDQDDVWLPNKLATFAELLATGVGWVCCDAEVCDAKLHSLGYTLWQRVRFNHNERKTAREGRLFEVLLKHFVVAGATLAFKAQARDRLLPIPREWHYDAWLVAVLAATEKGVLVELPMQLYRQHGDNAVGGLNPSWTRLLRNGVDSDRLTYLTGEIARLHHLLTRLESILPKESAPPSLTTSLGLVSAKLAHLNRRATLSNFPLGRWPQAIRDWTRGEYRRWATDWRSLALDLFIPNKHSSAEASTIMDRLIRFARRLRLPRMLRVLGLGKPVGLFHTWNLHRTRSAVAKPYLRGVGLEIGALHFPLRLPPNARALYLDLASREENIRRYSNVNPKSIVKTDIVANGFRLDCIRAECLNFVIANHVLEHTENPLGALRSWASLIRRGGHLFITVPIAEECFDRGRPVTSLDHLIDDLRLAEMGEWKLFDARTQEHYREWVLISETNLNLKHLSDAEAEERWKALAAQKTQIHFHTFSLSSLTELLNFFCTDIRPDFSVVELRISGAEIIALLQYPAQ